ncbi:hypothetical protein [Cytobacillus pseudoceanisediminis]|uniref:hypothetical protein n=1 Tax=Cytobacillus pseudoceanisediminis TaxID=3051614 RepID=UPI003C2B81AB
MSFHIDNYIASFWERFEQCSSKDDYMNLLKTVETMSFEYLNSLDGEDYENFFDKSPLLAMISEIQQACPEAVVEYAEESVVLSSAHYILLDYSEDDRAYLRRHFLKKDDNKVIFLDFDKRKRK